MLRGIKTLAVRMRRALPRTRIAVAAFLERAPAVEQVLYPGLPSHPGHEIAAHQMRDFGGMVSFLAESEEEAVAICARTKIFQLAESLGGVESLIEHPARMTHASTADAPFAAPRNLVRLSVGIESADDLVADLEHALVRSTAAPAPDARAARPGRRPELDEFLRLPNPAVVATLRPDGSPHTVPDVVRLGGRPRATEHGRHPAAAQLHATRPAGRR